jgi:glycosyltransferase involved in cell wall biosynthesis
MEAPSAAVAYLSTFPPRACGIATFTQDLTNAMDNLFSPAINSYIIAMNASSTDAYRYPKKVIATIHQNKPDTYALAAQEINENDAIKILDIQHEFGIFGGDYGNYLIPFLDAIKKPIVLTFHTVLPNPDAALLSTVTEIAKRATKLIVMTQTSKDILCRDYPLNESDIHCIPHGIHPHPYTLTENKKKELGYENKTVLLTFGLLSRGKGIEYVIESLPNVVKKHPDVIYLICGMTHPSVLKKEGEEYRNQLIELTKKLGLSKHVKFYNEYLSLTHLLHFLEMTDIYISPSLNLNQAVSGTLSYAFGMGRAIISTAFMQAKELVTKETGLLVDPKKPVQIEKALLHFLNDKNKIIDCGKNAYFRSRTMSWPNVALKFSHIFTDCYPEFRQIRQFKRLPAIKLDHIERLTDDFGMLQFAHFSTPDPESGYTLDDNARAFRAVSLYYEKHKKHLEQDENKKQKQALLKLITLYFNLMEFCAKDDGRFDNYINIDKTFNENANTRDSLEDANARALYAIAVAATRAIIPKNIKDRAIVLLNRSLTKQTPIESPRALAFQIKALCQLISNKQSIGNIDLTQRLDQCCQTLIAHYQSNHSSDWDWFEHYLTYANATLSEALLLSYQITKNDTYRAIGKNTLDFLIKTHFLNDQYVPIGQDGWYQKGGTRSYFDQQPEDVAAMIQTLSACYQITKDARYKTLKQQAFDWFLGDNMCTQIVYDEITGGCGDGLGEHTVNLNQGAESTVAYLLSRLIMTS